MSLSLLDLRGISRHDLRGDLVAAVTVTLLGIPQGIAYAIIAGLPPVMGLYAAFLPTIFGALFRSSRHVLTAPSNALSLLVGTAVAAAVDTDPVQTALLLAAMVGIMQVAAGLLRLGVLVDYISMPVVAGYISGAGVLIAVGQLPNLTHTPGAHGNLFVRLQGWGRYLDQTSLLSLALGLGTALAIVALRRWRPRFPAPLVVLAVATAGTWIAGVGHELLRISDLAPVPAGLPPLDIPSFHGWLALVPFAVAVNVLSLVESSSVARALATQSGQKLDLSQEFVGQGIGNLAASVSGGYPTSGSLARSALNFQSGARTRLAGVFSGLLVGLALLVLGPVIDHTPLAALAGLLVVIAIDLVDLRRIRSVVYGRRSDAMAFLATLVGTWVLRLDQAIYLGVALSLFFYLRRARMLRIEELHLVAGGAVVEGVTGLPTCAAIRILQIDGQLFFAAGGELQAALDDAAADPSVAVVILRLRRALQMDATVAGLLGAAGLRLRESGRRLILVGLDENARDLLQRTGALAAIGAANVHERSDQVLGVLEVVVDKAHRGLGPHRCGGALAEDE